ncbi:MAG: Type 1 glutamine amidotransferase-like domain-containing protein [Burkholderiales bacterium]
MRFIFSLKITEQVANGKTYIGESAGSIVVSPNIEYIKDMDDCNAAPELVGFDALNLVDFYPLPHHTNFPFKEAVETIISKYESSLKLVPISNSQAIVVTGKNMKIL